MPRPQKLFVPFQVEDPRPGDPPARPARPRRPGKTVEQRGPGRTKWVLPGPPSPAPQTARHPHAGHYLPCIERFGHHTPVTTAPCGHPEAGVPGGDRGRGPESERLGRDRAPATPFASAPPPRERRFWRRRQSQPLVQRLDQCETRSCEKSPPLARPWPMAGRIFFGRASFLAFRSPLTFACSEPAGSYQAVLSGAARGGGGGGSHGVLFHCV